MWVQLVWQVVIALVAAFAAYALTPKTKQKTDTLRPQDITTPTVTAGTPIQVVFGRVRIRNPNILWFGNQSTTQIKK